MITVDVLVKNSVTLPATETLILEEGRIVCAIPVGDNTEILYAKSLDRRDRPDVLIADDAVESDLPNTFFEANILKDDGTTETWHINPAFVEYIRDSKYFWNGAITTCVAIEFTEGAFLHKVVYAQGAVGDDGDIEITTTTTPEPVVTTTTTPVG